MTRVAVLPHEQTRNTAPEFVDRRGMLSVFGLLANAPAVFVGWTTMVDEVLDSTTFSARLRELIILRVAYLQNSLYELSQHLDVGKTIGIPACQRDAVTSDANLAIAGFDDVEMAVLEFVTELCRTHRVRDQTFDTARTALGEEALTELLVLVSLYYGLALVLNAAELAPDDAARLRT